MANTYTQIYIHAVFAVSARECLIGKTFKEPVQKYISGILRNENQKLLAINTMPDHLHMLFGMLPDIALSDLIGKIKASSSHFININRYVRGRFSWQEGFGAFSHSKSQIPRVAKYIETQEQHHGDKSFRKEYMLLLRKFDVAFDERYLFRWILDD